MGWHLGSRGSPNGPRRGPPLLLALPLLALPAPSAAIVGVPKLFDASLVQAAQTARAAQAVAEAAARAAFLSPIARVPSAGAQDPQAAAGSPGTGSAAAVAEHLRGQVGPAPSESTDVRQENERLRHERSQLAEDVLRLRQQSVLREAQWQQERLRLSKEDSELRLEDAKLRQEDSALREALGKAETGASRRRAASLLSGGLGAQGFTRKSKAALAVAAVVVLGCACAVHFFGSCFIEDAEDDEDEDTLRHLVEDPGPITCMGCLRCFCRPYVCMCTSGVVFVSGIFALVLWEMGLLQPIFSQLMVYAYIMGIVALFVGMLAYEIWVLVARSIRVVLDKINHPLAKARKNILRQKHKYLECFDDGEHNPVVGSTEHWGDRERRQALWQASQRQVQRNKWGESMFH